MQKNLDFHSFFEYFFKKSRIIFDHITIINDEMSKKKNKLLSYDHF
ncbi:hypothetical protein R7U63_01670 [Mesomycoplasma ovipneumoniae]|nr:hypothetical protein [Mesomycoplasma ovipneumoniae]